MEIADPKYEFQYNMNMSMRNVALVFKTTTNTSYFPVGHLDTFDFAKISRNDLAFCSVNFKFQIYGHKIESLPAIVQNDDLH